MLVCAAGTGFGGTLRTTTEKSVLQCLHQNTALSLTHLGPLSLCLGCWKRFSGRRHMPSAMSMLPCTILLASQVMSSKTHPFATQQHPAE